MNGEYKIPGANQLVLSKIITLLEYDLAASSTCCSKRQPQRMQCTFEN